MDPKPGHTDYFLVLAAIFVIAGYVFYTNTRDPMVALVALLGAVATYAVGRILAQRERPSAPEAHVHCAACGRDAAAGAKHCAGCGAALAQA
jgi:uncharacterized protein (DUF58 family)